MLLGQNTVQGGIDNNQIFGGDEGDTLVVGFDDDLKSGSLMRSAMRLLGYWETLLQTTQ